MVSQETQEDHAPPSPPNRPSSLAPLFKLLTPSIEHGPHDGGKPCGLTVAGLEVTLKVSEEDADTGREAHSEALGHQGGYQDYPGPSAIRLFKGPGHSQLLVLPQPYWCFVTAAWKGRECPLWLAGCQPSSGPPAALPG